MRAIVCFVNIRLRRLVMLLSAAQFWTQHEEPDEEEKSERGAIDLLVLDSQPLFVVLISLGGSHQSLYRLSHHLTSFLACFLTASWPAS